MAPRKKPVPMKNSAVQIQRRTKINEEIQTKTIPWRQTASDFEKLTTEGLKKSPKLIAEKSRSVWLYKTGVNQLQKNPWVCYIASAVNMWIRGQRIWFTHDFTQSNALFISSSARCCAVPPRSLCSCTSLTNLLMQVHGTEMTCGHLYNGSLLG